jgi:murein DD-endopeptidase MepM/ murein hydrolase activator NlpD
MFEGISEIAGRVAELKSALDSYTHPSDAPAPASSSPASGPNSTFQQTLKQAQAPAHQFSVGTNGASQMPASPGSGSALAGLGGAGGLASLGLGGGGLGLLSGMGDGLGSGGLTGLGTSDPAGNLGGLAGLGLDASSGGLGGLAGLGLGTSDPTGGSAGLGLGAGSQGALASLGLGPNGQSGPGGLGLGLSGEPSNPLQGLVGQVASQQGVNPALAQAVAKAESGYNPSAVSPAGAQGLMQLMPGTFSRYAQSAYIPGGVPVQGNISQAFGPTDFGNEPAMDWNGQHYAHFHTGVDLAASQGTPIRATVGGTVEIRSDPQGFGNLVVVRHGPWDVLYGHTSGQPGNIQTGSVVRPGDVIGFVGSTGNSTGPHVHYEIRYQGHIVDPTPFTNGAAPGGSPMDPVANAKAGVGYLKDMLTRFKNNVPEALAAYNAGPGAVEKYGGIPPYPETQAYVQKTMQYAHDLGA